MLGGTGDLVGRRIARVCLVGATHEATYRKLESAVRTRAGEPLDAKRIRDDTLRLAAHAEFEEAAIMAERRGEDVVVVVAVSETPRLAAVVVEQKGRASCEPPAPLAVCGHVRAADLGRAKSELRREALRRGEGPVDVNCSASAAGDGLLRLRCEVTPASGEHASEAAGR